MFEIGWKTALFDRRVRLSASLFYYDYKDLQVTRAASDPTTGAVVNLTENATTAKLKGIALDLGWAITSRSEEHTSELQSLMRISYAVVCLKKKTTTQKKQQ